MRNLPTAGAITPDLPQEPESDTMLGITDLQDHIEAMMSKLENALFSPYPVASIQKDYEKILITLAQLEKKLDAKSTMHYSANDAIGRAGAGRPTVEELLQEAVKKKSEVDEKFQRISTAASAAKTKVDS